MTNKISHISLQTLNIQELVPHLPAGVTHLTIDKASLGPQPRNTFIVGAIQDVFPKTIFKGIQKKRMTLREVLVDETEGKQLDVFSYDSYAHELENALGQDYSQIWVIFMAVHLDKYMGFSGNKAGWCDLRISLRPSAGPQSGDESQPRVWLVKKTREMRETVSSNEMASQFSLPQRPQPVARSNKTQFGSIDNNRNIKKTNYTSLNNCKDGRKHDVMAVVKEIAKLPKITAKGSYHTIIIVVDPSCLEEEARLKDVLVHVFLNDKKPSGEAMVGLPGGVNKGDILRLHDMKGENFRDKMHGKVFSAFQVVKFSSDKNEPVSPISAHTDYLLSKSDREQVIKLRDWWERVSSQFEENPIQEQRDNILNNNKNDNQDQSYLEEYSLNQITKEMTFNLICQVLQVRRVSACDKEMVLLLVRDGTHTKVPTHQIDPANATQELLSQTEYCTDAGSGIVLIHVWSKLDEAKEIEPGGFYKLKKIEAIQHVGSETDSRPLSFLELIMNNDYCTITRLQENHNEVRKIKRRLEGKVSDDNFDVGSQSSFAKIANDLFMADPFAPENNPYASQQRKSPGKTNSNRINSQPKIVPTTTFAPTLHTIPQSLYEVARSKGLPSQNDSLDHAMGSMVSQHLHTNNRDPLNPSCNNIVQGIEDMDVVPGPSRMSIEDRLDISNFPLDLPCSTQLPKEQLVVKSPVQQSRTSDQITQVQHLQEQCLPQTNVKIPNQSAAHEYPVAPVCVGDSSSTVYAAVSEDLRLPPTTPSPDSTSAHRSTQQDCDSISGTKVSRDSIVNKLTELDKTLPELKFEDLQSIGTELGSYSVDVMIKEVYCMSSKPLENTKDLGVSDWVWGLCIACDNCTLQSWELREQYSKQDIMRGELPCQTCNLVPLSEGRHKARRSSNNSLHACMRLVLLLCSPEDEDKNLLVSLAGDHAHHFFGIEPGFFWILAETDPTAEEIGQRLSTILDGNLSLTLGISKYVLSNGITKFQITNTKLKV